ncbi:hypothetical protein DFH08DRAFT_976352 [Mycena albidolilacea]|uniref:Uncharacterized protein n=1 Tax=Mycena albidolilacea TaxID=1033008 RepID=A0AAD6Z3N8_9AGAR|nr:hypothetical protein DFH08DRAFT_976352 [Mycena albidolilacea]
MALSVFPAFTSFRSSVLPAFSDTDITRNVSGYFDSTWEGTITQILASGGKAGTDWVRDKESCKFVFPGICWEKSLIPLTMWNVGESNTNLIEMVHSDVNCEGQYEAHGIHSLYAAVTPVMNTVKNVKRRATQQGKKVVAHAHAVVQHNAGMQKAHDTLRSWNQYVYALECLPLTPSVISPSCTPEYHRQLSVARVMACQAQNRPIPIQISESLANALARSNQVRHDLIYGGIAPPPTVVAV